MQQGLAGRWSKQEGCATAVLSQLVRAQVLSTHAPGPSPSCVPSKLSSIPPTLLNPVRLAEPILQAFTPVCNGRVE